MNNGIRLLVIQGLLASLTACGGWDAENGTSARSGTGGTSGAGGSAAGGLGGAGGQAATSGTGGAATNTIEYDGLNGRARDPIISHVFTADPSAHVFQGRIYLYASHDLDDQTGYNMRDYHVFSTNDLVNWQDHGVAFDIRDTTWAHLLYAPDAAYSEATGKYYLYFPNGGGNIGVAVSDHPGGPFADPLGKPLINAVTPGVEDVDWIFDPGVLVDDDGQAYLYFGGGFAGTGDNARVIRLGADMVSLADPAATTLVPPDFFEASFAHKREGKYYFSYSTTFSKGTATIDYMMSDDPMTGWEFKGTIMANPTLNYNQNHHHSIVEYEGSWYIFYHHRGLSRRDGYGDYQRSVTFDRLTYAADGTIEQVPPRQGEIRQLRNLDAFSRLEAETLADQRGIEVTFAEDTGTRVGVAVTDVHDQDWIGYSQVDFGAGATSFTARVAADAGAGGTVDVYLDGCDRFSNLPGVRVGSCAVNPSGGWQTWTDVTCAIDSTTGVHDVYLRFTGTTAGPLLNIDYFQFE